MDCFSYRSRNSAIPTPNFAELAKATHFKKKELIDLFKRFEVICDQQSGRLSPKALSSLPEFIFCPLQKHLSEDEIDFEGFAMIANTFSSRASSYEKMKFLLEIVNKGAPAHSPRQTPVIKKLQVLRLLGLLIEGDLSDAKRDEIALAMWNNISTSDEAISQNDFLKLISYFDMHSVMTIDLV